MTPRERVDLALAELGGRIGLEGMRLEEDGSAVLMLDEVVVNMELDDAADRLLLYAGLGRPTGGWERLYEALLRGNFLWAATRGATLSLEPAGGEVMLQQAVAASGLDGAALESLLEGFADAAESWAGRVAAAGDEAAPPAGPHDGEVMLRV
jgi:Tir chaperone protein (CesT) family